MFQPLNVKEFSNTIFNSKTQHNFIIRNSTAQLFLYYLNSQLSYISNLHRKLQPSSSNRRKENDIIL